MGKKGEETRAALLEVALKLFRKRGFDATTMRDVAAAAGLSLGASYYYFRSKEEIVLAYYEEVQTAHERALPADWPEATPLEERLYEAVAAKLRIVARDARFLGALFRYAAEPSHPLGVFDDGTAAVRARAIAVFRRALAGRVDPALEEPFAQALWLAHLGVLLLSLRDARPERAERATRALARAADRVAALSALPPVRAQIDEVLALLAKGAEAPAPQPNSSATRAAAAARVRAKAGSAR